MSLLLRGGGGGGEGPLFWGEGHNFFPSCMGGGSQFFQSFLGESHNSFKSIFIEKINYEYPAAAGFRFLLILPLPSKKKCPEGRNKIYMNLDVRYCILKKGKTDRQGF